MRAPRLLAVGTAAASLLLLTGCEKPTPIVSVVSGGAFEWSEAVSFCFEGQDPSKEPGTEGACTFHEGQRPELIRVKVGDQVGVDVDRELAEQGYEVVLRPQGQQAQGQQGQAQRSGAQTGHYFAFVPQFQSGPLDLEVHALSEAKEGAQVVGIWRFVLAPR